MPFVKTIKNKAYFMRYQVKYRRRREGKTDYQSRAGLVTQDRRKFNTPKYRLVVRISNRDVTCQVIYARIIGDVVLCAAYSHELPRYGLPVGLTNYAACYATGLLLARRLLKKVHLDDSFTGVTKVTGDVAEMETAEDGPRPFTAYLDTGLAHTSTGARVFAALKGAADGGLNVPHNEKRMVGFKPAEKEKGGEKKEGKFNVAVLRDHIFGKHVALYMKRLEKEEPEKFAAHFSQYIKHGITADGLEKIIKSVHEKIRADPDAQIKKHEFKPELPSKAPKRQIPLNLKQRHDRFRQKLAAILKRSTLGKDFIMPVDDGKLVITGGDEEEEEKAEGEAAEGEAAPAEGEAAAAEAEE